MSVIIVWTTVKSVVFCMIVIAYAELTGTQYSYHFNSTLLKLKLKYSNILSYFFMEGTLGFNYQNEY